MAALTASLFAGWFPQTLRGRLFETITGRWFGTVLGVLIQLFLQFLYCLIELSGQLCLCVDYSIKEPTVDVNDLTCCNNFLFISSFVNQTTFFR